MQPLSVKLLDIMRDIKARILKKTQTFIYANLLPLILNFFHELVTRLISILGKIWDKKGIYITTLPVLSGGSIGVYRHIDTQENPMFPHCFSFQINSIADVTQQTLHNAVYFPQVCLQFFLLSDLTPKPLVTCTSRHCKGLSFATSYIDSSPTADSHSEDGWWQPGLRPCKSIFLEKKGRAELIYAGQEYLHAIHHLEPSALQGVSTSEGCDSRPSNQLQ